MRGPCLLGAISEEQKRLPIKPSSLIEDEKSYLALQGIHPRFQVSAPLLAAAASWIQYETEEGRPGTHLQFDSHCKVQMSGLQVSVGQAIFKINR